LKVLVTGATGFIGKRLVKELARDGHDVVILSRNSDGVSERIVVPCEKFTWHPESEPAPRAAFQGVNAVFHLAGESVAKRWTADQKRKIQMSRVLGTRHLVQTLSQIQQETPDRLPEILVSASAIGFYGDRTDETLSESSSAGQGFLASVCREWESEVFSPPLNLRRVALRTGIVLGEEGGALQKMLPPFRMGAGGPLGSGLQWMSWIHIDDLVGMFLFAWKNKGVNGVLNGVSPHPVTNLDFSKALGRALNRPVFMKVPAFALKVLMGEMAEMVLASQKVLPASSAVLGFSFRYPELNLALESILKKKA
jgi:uncharacterized protein